LNNRRWLLNARENLQQKLRAVGTVRFSPLVIGHLDVKGLLEGGCV
jgi:hypothetical protein